MNLKTTPTQFFDSVLARMKDPFNAVRVALALSALPVAAASIARLHLPHIGLQDLSFALLLILAAIALNKGLTRPGTTEATVWQQLYTRMPKGRWLFDWALPAFVGSAIPGFLGLTVFLLTMLFVVAVLKQVLELP